MHIRLRSHAGGAIGQLDNVFRGHRAVIVHSTSRIFLFRSLELGILHSLSEFNMDPRFSSDSDVNSPQSHRNSEAPRTF